ncbi:MAG: molybdopterin-containing oxidoreductase family protein [Ilumatobacteraceae bacterium]
MARTVTSFCRFCHAFCGIKVTVEDGRATKVIGDVDNPMYHGFTCVKGRALPEQHAHPDRLLHSMRRMPDGSHAPVAFDDAVDAIAAQLTDIVAESGPRAVALYAGTFSFHYPAGNEVAKAFMRAIGSRMRFSSGSIDQPGKGIARALHGSWNAGPQPFAEADTWMLVGANPTISMWGGIPQFDPARRLREAKARGMRLIVIDPRRTEAAANADLFLQPKPGEDPTILAGIVRVILEEGLEDRPFLDAEVEGVDDLRDAVAPFTPQYVERRAGVPAALVVEAARTFANGSTGSVTAGTGPNMAPRGTLTEYLIACIQTLCGRWLRPCERVPNPFVLMPTRDFKAQADAPQPVSGFGEQLRVRGLGDNAGGLPTAALADEILLEGDGRVRALFSLGGNPMAAWPDQLKTVRAMEALDLHVALDIKMSATAKLADWVIAPKLSLEADGITMPNETIWGYGAATTGYPEPYAQFAPAIVDPPEGSDVVEEWELFYALGQRMGLTLKVAGVELDMERKPTTDDLHQLMTRRGRIPLDEVKRYPSGHVFEDPSIVVQSKEDGWPHRLQVGAPSMLGELVDVAAEPVLDHAGYRADEVFAYRLVSRRMLDVYNSSGRDIPHLVRKFRYNPAFMNPADLDAEGLAAGDIIEIDSGHAQILGVVEAAPDVAPGVISMAHAFGDAPKHDPDVRTIGSNTGRLSSTDRDYDPISGIPVMSAIPVNVRRSDENLVLA